MGVIDMGYRFMHYMVAFLGAAATHMSASAAWYTSATDIRLTNVALNVYDLRPDDGIAPAFWAAAPSTTLEAGYYDHYTAATDSQTRTLDAAGAVALQTGASTVQSAWQGSPGALSASIAVVDSRGDFHATATQTMRVSVAPHTAFVVSGLMVYTGDYRNIEHYSSDVKSWAKISFAANDGTRNERQLETGFFVEDRRETFALSYANVTDVVRDVDVTYELYSKARIIPSVPEPSTWAMLGAGLLALAIGRRRPTAPVTSA
jgi:hypothetical protein